MKMKFKRAQSFLLALVIAVSLTTPLATYAQTDKVSEMTNAAGAFLNTMELHQFANWDVFALSRAGIDNKTLAEKYYNEVKNTTSTQMGKKTTSDVANMILCLGAYGYDTVSVGTHKLHDIMLAKLAAMDFSDSTAYVKGYATTTTIMSPYYVIKYLKMDTSKAGITENQLAFYMAKHLSDRANYAYNDEYPSIEAEAMLMVALAPLMGTTLIYGTQSIEVNKAVATAVDYYKSIQAKSGGFTGIYGESVEANSWILHALNAVNADTLDFTHGGKTPLDGVTSFFDSATGGFKGYGGVNEFSTQQALYNLVGYSKIHSGGHLYDISDTHATKPAPGEQSGGGDKTEDTPTGTYAKITVEHSAVKGEVYELNEKETPASLLVRALGKENVELSYGYISAVKCGDTWYREFEAGTHSGWKFMVNGQYIQQGGTVLKVKSGDSIEWRYITGDIEPEYGGDQTPTDGKLKLTEVEKNIESRLSATDFIAYDWDILCKAASKKEVTGGEIAPITATIIEKNGDLRKITDLTKYAILLKNAGENPANIDGIDIYNKIYNNKNMYKQGINGPIFSLIALNSAGDIKVPSDALWSRTALTNEILNAQNVDGGWGLSRGVDSSIDLTAMALVALAPYKTHYAEQIDRALVYLSGKQQSNGGFIENKLNNTESAAQVIMALVSLGIDTEDERFVKDEHSVVDALLTFALPDGTFTHGTGKDTDPMSTQQGTLAILALKKTGNIYAYEEYVYDDFAYVSEWAKDGVKKCKQMELMLGDGLNFMPHDVVTALQMNTILSRALGSEIKGGNTPVTRGELYTRMSELSCGELLEGDGAEMHLSQPVTREMMATVAWRIFKK